MLRSAAGGLRLSMATDKFPNASDPARTEWWAFPAALGTGFEAASARPDTAGDRVWEVMPRVWSKMWYFWEAARELLAESFVVSPCAPLLTPMPCNKGTAATSDESSSAAARQEDKVTSDPPVLVLRCVPKSRQVRGGGA